METIIIDGKTYQLIPIETDDAAKKADYYRNNYSDYKNISREELINRIKKIDQMSEWEYCKYSMEKWIDWEGLYNAVSTQINKRSVSTGYFRVIYNEGYINDDGIYEYPEISLDVEIYGNSHTIEGDRDYLNPDDQT